MPLASLGRAFLGSFVAFCHLMNTFDFNGTALRTIELDGNPWFHATDVCRCLGLNISSGTYSHLLKLDGDEKRTLSKTPNPAWGAAAITTDAYS